MARGSFQNEIPPSRINIKYKKETDGANEEVELPLKLLVVGDYTQRDEETPIEERKPINVSKDNFEKVMKAQDLKLELNQVPNYLAEDGGTMEVKLDIEGMEDFLPENIAKKVPQLHKLLEVRKLLEDIKGKVINKRGFQRELERIIKDEKLEKDLMNALEKTTPRLSSEQGTDDDEGGLS